MYRFYIGVGRVITWLALVGLVNVIALPLFFALFTEAVVLPGPVLVK